MNYLITGCCGFIGHHFLQHLFNSNKYTNIIGIDALTYASNGLNRLREIDAFNMNNRFNFFSWDLSVPISECLFQELKDTNIIIHLAAETHVDNSISDPVKVIQNNINSTLFMLEFARKLPRLKKFVYFSTDEVFGPALGDKLYHEDERHKPTNPYSASKSSGESLCYAYYNTYNIPIIITNCMNAFGERQHVEKFIPMTIKNIMNGNKVLIHADPSMTKAGTRFYIHARNIAACVLFILENERIGENYNIIGEKEVSNLELAQLIASIMKMPLNYEMINFHETRPGHDMRYGLDGTKLKKMGWSLPINFEDSFKKTIEWTIANQKWIS